MNNTDNGIKLYVRAYPIAEPKSNVMEFHCLRDRRNGESRARNLTEQKRHCRY